jgi:transcriptional regulator with XRE-family HTH domain
MSKIQDDATSDLTARIAGRVRGLRVEQGYSLDQLAARTGVSRSTISLIERQATSPTAVVLEKLSTGLDVPLASLFDAPPDDGPPSPVARRAARPRWRDPETGYVRRDVTSPTWPSPIRIVEVDLPAGATVAYETAGRDVTIHQQVWVLSGKVEVTLGDEVHRLDAGDCLALRLDRPIAYRNGTARDARYAVVIVTDRAPTRRGA